jgi:hypothetical protein
MRERGDSAPRRFVHRHSPRLQLGAGAAVDHDDLPALEPRGEVREGRDRFGRQETRRKVDRRTICGPVADQASQAFSSLSRY